MSRHALVGAAVPSLLLLFAAAAYGQTGAPGPANAAVRDLPRTPPPPLFFSESWRQGTKKDGSVETAEVPVTQQNVGNADLELDLIGPGAADIQATGIPGNKGNPMHVWTGLCTTPCGAALRDKDNYVDLTGLASIKWNTKVSGMHAIRPVVKLADGTWLVGDQTSGSTIGWLESELAFASMKWLKLDPERAVTTGTWIEHPDLGKVDEVGFVDLMPGSGHGPGGWSDVAQIEVYGKAVPRR
ncbi:MAG TPA: hypothetical protein VF329_02175 [Gammaproteobacteria bacterium]